MPASWQLLAVAAILSGPSIAAPMGAAEGHDRSANQILAQAEPNSSPRPPNTASRQSIDAAKSAASSKSLQDIKKSLGMKQEPMGEMTEIPSEVLFNFNSDRLRPEAVNVLAECAEMIRRDGNKNMHVIGHTDSVGPASYNLSLSKRRAEAVTNWLVTEGGIPKEALIPAGAGADKPKASNATATGRMKNRRVEVVMPMGESPHQPVPESK